MDLVKSDVVPLDLNNRVLVAQGLRRIRAGRCVPGLAALLEVAGLKVESVVAQELGFQVGPRLNAAGRLEDMTLGIDCLLTDDPGEARTLAARLAELNTERREIEARMQGEALAQVDALVESLEGSLPAGLCLYDDGWHQGVIGLVASRVKERVHRPVIAFAPGDPGWVKGSARSVPGLHVRDVLDAVAAHHPGLLEKFGGHAMAAGMTLRADRLDDFLLLPAMINLSLAYLLIRFFYRSHFNHKPLKNPQEFIQDQKLATLSKMSLVLLVTLIALKILMVFTGASAHFRLTFIALIAACPIILFSSRRLTILKDVDWRTLIFFAAMFVLMESVWDSGFFQSILERLDLNLASVGMIFIISIVLSQFISNVPLVALYLPMLAQLESSARGMRKILELLLLY